MKTACKTWCGGTEQPPFASYERKGRFYCRNRCVRAAVKAERGVPITLNGQPATLGFMSTEYAAGVIANLQAENAKIRAALTVAREALDELRDGVYRVHEEPPPGSVEAIARAETIARYVGTPPQPFGPVAPPVDSREPCVCRLTGGEACPACTGGR